MEKDRIKYYFVSDLHLGHERILRFQPERARVMGIDPYSPDAIKEHDEWIINKWQNTIRKKDYIYILGDFSFWGVEETRKILEQLPGQKYIVWGNHDKSTTNLTNYFKGCYNLKEVVFRQKNKDLDFLQESFRMEMCHYPMVAWHSRMHGACHIHGHVHGNLDEYNTKSEELRVDVGFDGKLANYGFVELEDLYNYFKKISYGMLFQDYINEKAIKDGIRY